MKFLGYTNTMTSTRPRFFSLHKLLTFFLFIFVFSFSIQAVFALTESEIPASCPQNNSANPSLNNSLSFERFYDCGDGTGYLCSGGAGGYISSLASCKKIEKRDYGICTGGFSIANCLSDIADFVIGNLVKIVNGILSWILSIAMYLLDLVIYITVVKFTQNFAELKLDLNPSGSLGGIGSGTGAAIFGSNGSGLIYYIWGMLRDFVNLLLLITIIYYAVKTMFEGFDNKAKIFLYLLVFSIVINFSLFFVKFAIDMSNILSLQAYTLMANPQSFENWEGFRKNASGGGNVTPNATLGDYLLNIASIGGAHKVSVGKDAAEQRINEGMKASWVYQVIVMLMYIGLIYIVFFLAGLLVMRAAAFLFAMLLAALLAADIFFSTFKQGDIEFANEIRTWTDKIRDDFYEALIKGPVLFLFLFLVGVLSNAIFNQSLQSEITSISSGSDEFKVFGTAFAASLAIFLKFAMFFALTKVLFDKLQVMKFGEKSWVGSGSNKIGNFLMRNTVGRAARVPGFVGRNYIARGFDKPGTIRNSLYNGLEKSATWLMSNKYTSPVTRGLGQRINKGLIAAKQGSWEFDQSKAAGRFAKSKIGQQITSAMGGNVLTDEGEYAGKGFRGRDEQRVKDRQKERADEAAVVRDVQGMTMDDIDIGRENQKIKGVGQGVDLNMKQMEAMKLLPGGVDDVIGEIDKDLANMNPGSTKYRLGKDSKGRSIEVELKTPLQRRAMKSYLQKFKEGDVSINEEQVRLSGLAKRAAEQKRDARARAEAQDFEYAQRTYVADVGYDVAARAQTTEEISGTGIEKRGLVLDKKMNVLKKYKKSIEDLTNLIDTAELHISNTGLTERERMLSGFKKELSEYEKKFFGSGMFDAGNAPRTTERFAANPYWQEEFENLVNKIGRDVKSMYADEKVIGALNDRISDIEDVHLPGTLPTDRVKRRSLRDEVQRKKSVVDRPDATVGNVARFEEATKSLKKEHGEAYAAVKGS